MTDDREHGDPAAMSPEEARAALWTPFLRRLPVTGASIAVSAPPIQSTIAASDPIAARVDELQFELGEGPHWEALRTGRPVLVPHLGEQEQSWPVFAAAARELRVGALFAIPMTLGAITVGVVDLYRSTEGALDDVEVASARTLAAAMSSAALRLAAQSATVHDLADGDMSPETRRVVHQATGMVLVQLGVSATEAFARLRAHAFAQGWSLDFVAQEVVARRLSFRDPTEDR